MHCGRRRCSKRLRSSQQLCRILPENRCSDRSSGHPISEYQSTTNDNLSFLLAALRSCSTLKDLENGKSIHAATRKEDLRNLFVANSLINMYSKCGSPIDAHKLFDKLPHRDVVSWTSLILGYVESGQAETALDLFSRMQTEDHCSPDARTFVAALKACTCLANDDLQPAKNSSLEMGEKIHSQAVLSGEGSNIFVQNTLVDMYAKCGCMVTAKRVFDGMIDHDVVSWNALLLGYVEAGDAEQALDLFSGMQNRERPDARTFLIVLKACVVLAAKEEEQKVDGKLVKAGALQKCLEIHSQVSTRRSYGCDCESDIFLVNILVTSYAKCGCLVESRSVFDRSVRHDIVSWNALLLGYAENGEEELALELFLSYLSFQPNSVTIVAALKACTSLAAREQGQRIHGKLIKVGSLQRGEAVHSQAATYGCETDVFVASATVDMFAKCGSLTNAREIFDRMQNRCVVSWNTLILGYAETDEEEAALELFTTMKNNNDSAEESPTPSPNSLTYVAALKACGGLVDLETTKEVHAEVCRMGFENDELVGTTLVDSYGKCGRMVDSQQTFDALGATTVVTWNALLSGYSRHGDTEAVFRLFHAMLERRVPVNGSSFVCLLTACSHAGLVDRGKVYFGEMVTRYGVTRGVEHYHCMVDLLSRGNLLDEAVAMAEEMPFDDDVVTWTTILSACRKWKNVEVGKVAFQKLWGLEGGKDGAACLLMNKMIMEGQGDG